MKQPIPLFYNDFQLVNLPDFKDDRGVLTFAEAGTHIPFEIKRVFWIYDVPSDKARGGHAHWTCHEVVVPVCGAFDILLDNGKARKTFHLDKPSVGVVIPAGVWCELSHFDAGTVCLVLASQAYDTEGYVNDYEEYRHAVSKHFRPL